MMGVIDAYGGASTIFSFADGIFLILGMPTSTWSTRKLDFDRTRMWIKHLIVTELN